MREIYAKIAEFKIKVNSTFRSDNVDKALFKTTKNSK